MLIGLEGDLIASAPVVGMVGAGIYLSAYTLLQTGVVRGQSYTYASLVIVAASCVAFSTIAAANMAVLAIQVSYIIISVVGILRLFMTSRMLQQTPEERAFILRHLPDLRREHVRALLKRGRWVDLSAGETLARQGAPLDQLYALTEGEASVTVDGKSVGTCSDCFIGELTFLTGEPATATVITAGPARLLVFESARLRALLKRKPDIKLALLAGFATSTKTLLIRRNHEALQHSPPRA
jgi:hypothetical protein